MRYLVISPFFWPHIGGSQRYMEELYAHIIRKNPKTKADVITYDTTGAPNKQTHRGMTIYRVPCIQVLHGQFAFPNPIKLFGVLMQLSSNTYDAVHANTRFFDSAWWAWAYARIIGTKSVLTDHVANHPIHTNRIINRIAWVLDHTLIRLALARYDLVTATNKKTQEFLITKLGVTNAILTYGGVDTKMYKPTKNRKTKTIPYIRKRFSDRDIIVTFAGRLIRTKGTMLFIAAIRDLVRNLPNHVYFVIAGNGPLQSEIASAIAHKSLAKKIFMTGALTASEIKQLLQSTDIFVHPSYHAEGFPNAILEAASSGCFVIATDNAGTKEIIQHNETGIIIRQHDASAIKRAIWWALTHPQKRTAIRQNCKNKTVERFDWNKLTDEFLLNIPQLYLSPKVSRGIA